MWSVERSRFDTLTIPLVVEKESYFIVSSRSAHTLSNNRYPSEKAKSDSKRRSKISVRDLIILKTLNHASNMKPHGRIVVDTDKKTPYPNFLGRVFGARLIHNRYDAGDPKESIKLFPVNNTMACMRAEIGKVKRESWYLTKDNTWLNAHLAIYTVYYNYFRIKKYTKQERGLIVVPLATGEAEENPKKIYEHKSPAMTLGIFDEPISFKFLMENYEQKFISAKARAVIPVSHQLSAKKVGLA